MPTRATCAALELAPTTTKPCRPHWHCKTRAAHVRLWLPVCSELQGDVMCSELAGDVSRCRRCQTVYARVESQKLARNKQPSCNSSLAHSSSAFWQRRPASAVEWCMRCSPPTRHAPSDQCLHDVARGRAFKASLAGAELLVDGCSSEHVGARQAPIVAPKLNNVAALSCPRSYTIHSTEGAPPCPGRQTWRAPKP